MSLNKKQKSKDVSTSIDDAAITAKVKGKIALEHPSDALNIHVETNNSVVTVTSHSKDALNRAKKIASGIEAVKEVITKQNK